MWASDVIQHDVEAADVDMIRFVGFFVLSLPTCDFTLFGESTCQADGGEKPFPELKVREMAWARAQLGSQAQQHRSHQHQDSMDPTPLYPQSQHRGTAVVHAEGWSPAVFWP